MVFVTKYVPFSVLFYLRNSIIPKPLFFYGFRDNQLIIFSCILHKATETKN